jgi:hypothetical protein
MVSMMWASRARIIVPRASAITSAVGARSRAPCMNAATQSVESSRPTRPITIAIARNSAAISSMNQSYFTTPITMSPSEREDRQHPRVARRHARAIRRRPSGCSWRFSWSST